MITFFFFIALFCAFIIGLYCDEPESVILIPIGLLVVLVILIVPNLNKPDNIIKLKKLSDNTILHIESTNTYSTNDTVWVDIRNQKLDPDSPTATKCIVLETIKTE